MQVQIAVIAKMFKESSLLNTGMSDYDYMKSLDVRYGVFAPELENYTEEDKFNEFTAQVKDLLQCEIGKDYLLFGPAMLFNNEKSRAMMKGLIFTKETKDFELNFEELDKQDL